MQRYHILRDDQWERIKDLLPDRTGTIGVTAKDNGCSSFRATRLALDQAKMSPVFWTNGFDVVIP